MNLDENTMNNIKNLVDNGNINDAISQISPEMIQNFSKMLNNNQSQNNTNEIKKPESNTNPLGNLDMNTISQISSAFSKMNNSGNDNRANLLNALKPYLRDSKKNKLDNYVNLLNVTKIAGIMNNTNNNKEENKNE